MAFCELKYYSKALNKATAANILLPENRLDGPFPVFICCMDFRTTIPYVRALGITADFKPEAYLYPGAGA